MLSNNASLLNERAINADISTVEGLAEITRLQTLAAALPIRTANRREELESKERALIEECHQFIAAELGPRCRELRVRAEAKVSDELRSHFAEAYQLQSAVENSKPLLALSAIQNIATIRHQSSNGRGAVYYAEELAQAWEDANKFEKQHLA